MTTGLRLAARGLWFRRSTALIVLLLAVVASAAAVIAPLYARAAEESILRDTLLRSDASIRSVHIAVPRAGTGAGLRGARDGRWTVDRVDRLLAHPAFGTPVLSYGSRGLYQPTAGEFAGSDVEGQIVERAGLCEHLRPVAGRCPRSAAEGMLSRRSLDLVGAAVGDSLEVEMPDAVTIGAGQSPRVTVRVVGAYDPVPVDGPYWAGHPYFTSFYPHGIPTGLLSEVPPKADPVFVGKGTAAGAGVTAYTIDVPVLAQHVGLDDTAPLRAQIRTLRIDLALYQLATSSELPTALSRADQGRELVRVAAPLAITQLVLLAWWTLYLVVGSATEERSPELGLAKLRGLGPGQTTRFGLAEVVLLLVLAAPLGTALGWGVTRAASGRVFAPGTEVVLTPTVLLTVLGAVAGGVATAALAARSVLRRPVGDLLRRVPPRRGGRKAGLLEGVVLALAIAGAVQLISDRGARPSPVALLAPGMIAVAGGLLAGRLLVRVARRRAGQALDQGRAPALVGWSGIARRPGTPRIAAVLAVATCLLLVGVEAWTVAERNRDERARAENGAAVVLRVTAPEPRELLTGVRAADPDGDFAMAVVQVSSSDQEPSVLAVDGPRADDVLDWGPPASRPGGGVRSALRPDLPQSILVRPGSLQVTADTDAMRSPSPLELAVRLDADGRRLRLPMGTLRVGRHTYTATVPGACANGCRLAALGVAHAATDIGRATAELTLSDVEAGRRGRLQPVAMGFRDPSAWRPGAPAQSDAQVTLLPGEALRVRLAAPGGVYAEVVRGDSPEPVPAVAGAAAVVQPEEAGGPRVTEATGMSGRAERYLTRRAVRYVPRGGRSALLVDLELALRSMDAAPLGERQVWLSRDDPGDEAALVRALGEAGIAVQGRESAAELERTYAQDGAVLALRLLLVCGGAAVLVSVGALLVAAYVGRRQRAYEVAALRAVGVRRRTVTSLLLRENLGTVLVALASGAVAAMVATWVVLPSLPQFDTPSAMVAARYAPDQASGTLAVAGLALVLGVVALVVAALQLRAGRVDRLREGVR